MVEIHLQRVTGADIEPFIDRVAELRIEVFREFPYLYDGDMCYERTYLRTYSESSLSLFVLARLGGPDGPIVGCSTGVPLADEDEAFAQPFERHGFDVQKIFYFGESVLQKPYRGRGVGGRFFDEREAFARSLQRFTMTAFCAVQRPADHPLRPEDDRPLDDFWRRRGYTRRPELTTTFPWKDVDEAQETQKPMVFWTRPLD